jgi:hypothetical protein
MADQDERWWSPAKLWQLALIALSAALAGFMQGHYFWAPGFLVAGVLFTLLANRHPTVAPVRYSSHYRWIGIIAVLITWGLFLGIMVYPSVRHWIKGPPPPLADDAMKWQLAEHLYDDLHGTQLRPPQPICIMHLDSDYSESLAHNITSILKLAGYTVQPCVRTGGADLPKGISIWSDRQGVVADHGQYIKNRFESIANLPVDFSFLDEPNLEKPFPLCFNGAAPCLAVTIGNPQS